MNFLLCVPDTEMGSGLEAAYAMPTLLRDRIFRVFLEKIKMKWKTEPSFLKWLKQESTSKGAWGQAEVGRKEVLDVSSHQLWEVLPFEPGMRGPTSGSKRSKSNACL